MFYFNNCLVSCFKDGVEFCGKLVKVCNGMCFEVFLIRFEGCLSLRIFRLNCNVCFMSLCFFINFLIFFFVNWKEIVLFMFLGCILFYCVL